MRQGSNYKATRNILRYAENCICVKSVNVWGWKNAWVKSILYELSNLILIELKRDGNGRSLRILRRDEPWNFLKFNFVFIFT